MAMLVIDRSIEERLKRERHATGADRYDEVWEGVYVMAPLPNNQHQSLVGRLTAILDETVAQQGAGDVFPGVNLSNRGDDWEHDFRAPDIAVFLYGGRAEDLGTHWRGPADFLVEIISPDDRTREKIGFYEQLGVKELLLVDRDPWRLELYRYQAGRLTKIAESTPESGETIASDVVPLSFRLLPAAPRPRIEVRHLGTGRNWLV